MPALLRLFIVVLLMAAAASPLTRAAVPTFRAFPASALSIIILRDDAL